MKALARAVTSRIAMTCTANWPMTDNRMYRLKMLASGRRFERFSAGCRSAMAT